MNCCYVADEGCPLPEEIHSEDTPSKTRVSNKATDSILMI